MRRICKRIGQRKRRVVLVVQPGVASLFATVKRRVAAHHEVPQREVGAYVVCGMTSGESLGDEPQLLRTVAEWPPELVVQ